jgi:hypothetical protein
LVWQPPAQEDDDGIRPLVESVVQEVLEAETPHFLQVEPYERTRVRHGSCDGYKPHLLKTHVSTIELLVPKNPDRKFQTELFERYLRSTNESFHVRVEKGLSVHSGFENGAIGPVTLVHDACGVVRHLGGSIC